MTQKQSQDAITEEERVGTAPSASPSGNAFTTLMTPKRKASPKPAETSKKSYHKNGFFNRRDGLSVYTLHPERYDASVIIYQNQDFVAIHDLYSKSSVHTLLLPRSTKINYMHPFDAFEDPEFLALVQVETKKLVDIVAKELQRKYGPFSQQDKQREAILNGEVDILDDGADLPQGRDWHNEVMTGIHSHPSMNHLHIHVLSRDRFSECLKHRKHYNSFATPFFVPMEDFPLQKDDPRRSPDKQRYLQWDLKCWRCGMGFGNKFAKLKEHLAEEFEKWKVE